MVMDAKGLCEFFQGCRYKILRMVFREKTKKTPVYKRMEKKPIKVTENEW